MDILILIFFGIVVAWLAYKPGYKMQIEIFLGVLGSLAADAFMNAFGFYGVTGYNTYSFVVAMIGALVIIYTGRSLQSA